MFYIYLDEFLLSSFRFVYFTFIPTTFFVNWTHTKITLYILQQMTLLQFFLNAIISPIKWRGLFFTYKNGDSWSAFLSRLYVKLHFKKSNNVSHNNPNIVNDVFVVVYQFLEGYNAHVVQKKLYRVNERSPQNPWNQFFKKRKLVQ